MNEQTGKDSAGRQLVDLYGLVSTVIAALQELHGRSL